MPWKERTAVEEKKAFLIAWQRREQSFLRFAGNSEYSRPTGYKWLERFEITGERGAGGAKVARPLPSAEVDGRGPAIAHPRTGRSTPRGGEEAEKERWNLHNPEHGVAGAVNHRRPPCGAEGTAHPRPARRRPLHARRPVAPRAGTQRCLVCGLQRLVSLCPTASAAIHR